MAAGGGMRRMMPRKTRIVATLGPASSSPARLRQLLRAGVDVVRLNFSHGSHALHGDTVRAVRQASADTGLPVAILQDLAGPKMRVGLVADDAVRLRVGAMLDVVEEHGVSTAERLTVKANGVVAGLRRGAIIRLADGLIELAVVGPTAGGVHCRVRQGGVLRSRQGVQVPGVHRGLSAFTARDRRDLAFGLSVGVDAVALSFVHDAEDVLAARRFMDRQGARPFLVAKIERGEALENLQGILEVASGVMVARGDLGVAIGVENVPMAQKRIIREALRMHRPVITATQMLESMIERPTPTRAEVSDVANAVLEGTDALMLSAETAIGQHPLAAVRTLARVAASVEASGAAQAPLDIPVQREDEALAMARAALLAARAVQARGIAVFTDSGRTARLVSGMRPQRAVFGFSYKEETLRRMQLFWGVTPLLIRRARDNDSMIAEAEALLLQRRLVRRGDQIVIVCGERVHSGATNTVKIHRLGSTGAVPLPRRNGRVATPARSRPGKASRAVAGPVPALAG
jgi:pyruvate kinase